ncbi:MAG TPA: 4'-phosphopantetheinyl transferase superfamily protein [Polyangiaceae bacterium]|nr:4'-phosphopantetheinyl transferase superfamily protein [Polyangiaceae bacterium]
MTPDVVFDISLEHGRCLGLRIPADADAVEALAERSLLGEERALTSKVFPLRRRAWVGGRAALRTVLARSGIEAPPILTDGRGAPIAPDGIAVSVSHKDSIAVALVARERVARVGVDVELDVVHKTDLSSRVLADDELAELAVYDARRRAREVLLRFSAKESVYKALDPFVRRYVGFKEVSVSTRASGDALVNARLGPGEGPFAIDVRWRYFDGLVLTTARVEPVPRSAA